MGNRKRSSGKRKETHLAPFPGLRLLEVRVYDTWLKRVTTLSSTQKMKLNLFADLVLGLLITADAYAQPDMLRRENAITTTVPFLMISPDARGGAMGDVGAATPADPNSGHWNPAKFAFIEKPGGMSLTYTPWLRQLVDGVSISYLSAYGKINKRSTLAGSLRFFSLGNINYTDD